MVGYGGSFVRGNTIFLNPLTPSGTLDFNYQRPYASVLVQVYRGFSYKMALELLRLQRNRKPDSLWPCHDSIAELQRQQRDVLVPLRVLSRNESAIVVVVRYMISLGGKAR